MALPLAIPAILAEGLVFTRRAIVTYRLTKSMIDPNDQINLFVQRGLKSHFMVKGEEFFLYLVGEKIIQSVYDYLNIDTSIRLEESEIEAVVIKALADPFFLVSSVDVSSVVSSFAYCLGKQWQSKDSNARGYLTSMLSDESTEAEISDVVRKYLSSEEALTERIYRTAHRLGLVSEELDFIVTLLKGDKDHDKILSDWEQAETSFLGQGVPLYKASTFQSFMLNGASENQHLVRRDIQVNNGSDAISLNLSYVPLGYTNPFKPDKYPDIATITSDQVKAMSERIMALQGFVFSESSKSWIPMSNAEITSENDIESFKDITSGDALLFSKGIVQSKTSSKMVFSWIEKYISEQPMAQDLEEWREVLETGKNALKLLSAN